MHRILYATDFSPDELVAFEQACKFAQAWKGKLLIAHVDDSPADAENDHEASKQNLLQLVPNDLAIDYQHILRTGDPATIVHDIEKEYDVDLIVLGTHGRKGVKRMFSGSIAESVIRSAHCPVLTMRQTHDQHRNPLTSPDHKPSLLVPVDFSVHSYVALDFASSIAISLDATITILHIDEASDDASEKVREGISDWSEHRKVLWDQLKKVEPREKSIEFDHKLLNSTASKHITQFANEQHYDYVVLGTHGRSGVGRALMGSVAEHVVRNAECPVITVKPSNKPNPDLHASKLAHHPPV